MAMVEGDASVDHIFIAMFILVLLWRILYLRGSVV